MSLVGTLKGFGVTEIFQLISQQMKTGALILGSPQAEVTIAFTDGIIKGIVSSAWERDPRAEVFIQGGYLSERELRAAHDTRKKNAPPWYDTLITQGKIKQHHFDKTTDMVIRRTLLDVFQWPEGSYRFEDWETVREGMLPCHLPAEGLILDTLRIVDEWPLIRSRVPAADYRPVTLQPVTEDLVKQYDLSEVDLRVFDLIDNNRTVESVVRRSLEMPFDALNAFVRLIDAGLVEVFPEKRQGADMGLARRIFAHRMAQASSFVLLGLLVVVLAVFGQPRITGDMLGTPRIERHIEQQRQINGEMLTQGKGLSVLDRDIYSR